MCIRDSNNAHPGIAKVLLEIIAMHFHPTIMAAEGQLAFQSMLDKMCIRDSVWLFLRN